MTEAPTITVTIENQRPVELIDFTRSLLALGDQFKREVEGNASGFESKLYVKELRKGSLVAELIVMVPVGMAVMEATNLTNDFVGTLRSTIDWLRAKGAKPEHIDTKTVANISTMVEPVAKDNGANFTVIVNGDVNAPITLNAMEANAVQNRALRYIQDQREPQTALHTKVLMYWAVVKNEGGLPASGEKAMIDNLHDRPVKVVFDSKTVREEMMQGQANPLKEAFIVDVEVQTVRGKIASYKVLQLHERIRLED